MTQAAGFFIQQPIIATIKFSFNSLKTPQKMQFSMLFVFQSLLWDILLIFNKWP